MLRRLEFTFTDGQINETCHIETISEVFDADGNSLGLGSKFRAAIDVATMDLDTDPGLHLSPQDKASIRRQITEAKRGRTVWQPPADAR